MSRRKPTPDVEPVMDEPIAETVHEAAAPVVSVTAPDEVIAITKGEIKAYAEQAARLAAGLSVPAPTLPPNVAAWRALAEQAAQIAVIAAGIADAGEAG